MLRRCAVAAGVAVIVSNGDDRLAVPSPSKPSTNRKAQIGRPPLRALAAACPRDRLGGADSDLENAHVLLLAGTRYS
jgi:hypothetical protein